MDLNWFDGNPGDVLRIEDEHLSDLDELISAVRAKRPRGLSILSQRSSCVPVLGFLRELPWLLQISLCGGITAADSAVLGSLSNLEELSLNQPPDCMQADTLPFHIRDFSKLSKLKRYMGEWHEDRQTGLTGLTELVNLCAYNMTTFTKALEGLPNAAALSRLVIHTADIASMRSRYRYSALHHISLFRCRKLVSLEGLAGLHGDRVDRFEVEGCTKLKDYSELASCTTLRCLNIERCGSIADLGFLKDMQHLERLIIWNTVIEDGDLSPLFGLKSLRMCSLSYKPHYSHGRTEIRRAFPDH